jgi:hypothetical protein
MNLNDLRVSLDLESVLAAVRPEFEREYEKRTGNPIFGEKMEWGFGNCQYDYSTFMEITASNWKHRWDQIEATEPDIAGRVNAIRDKVGRLDVVTNRRGFDQKLQLWLEKHGIQYDHFLVADHVDSKIELPYEVFIDDRPGMANDLDVLGNDDQYLLVYNQPWNRDVRERLNVTRVDDLVEGCFVLEQKFALQETA